MTGRAAILGPMRGVAMAQGVDAALLAEAAGRDGSGEGAPQSVADDRTVRSGVIIGEAGSTLGDEQPPQGHPVGTIFKRASTCQTSPRLKTTGSFFSRRGRATTSTSSGRPQGPLVEEPDPARCHLVSAPGDLARGSQVEQVHGYLLHGELLRGVTVSTEPADPETGRTWPRSAPRTREPPDPRIMRRRSGVVLASFRVVRRRCATPLRLSRP